VYVCYIFEASQSFSRSLFSRSFFGVVLSSQISLAGNSQNATGWLWDGMDASGGGDTAFGWVSLNSRDCDTNSDGTVSAAEQSAHPGCPTGSIADYGVNIPTTDGVLSGYAWSANYGWISFNAGDVSGCPMGTCSARRTGNSLQGWARILSLPGANGGGWTGFVSLDSATVSSPVSYGVTVAGTAVSGYMWSNELGWINVNATLDVAAATQSLKICQISCVSGIRLDTTAMAAFSMNKGETRQLYACLGATTDSCSGSDVPVAATWGEISTAPFNDAIDRVPVANPASSIAITAKAVGNEKLTTVFGTYSAEAVANVVCNLVIPACDPGSSDALNTCTGSQYTMTYTNNCTLLPDSKQCPGVKSCGGSGGGTGTGNPNWVEVAP
jgi:hypothetical protein